MCVYLFDCLFFIHLFFLCLFLHNFIYYFILFCISGFKQDKTNQRVKNT